MKRKLHTILSILLICGVIFACSNGGGGGGDSETYYVFFESWGATKAADPSCITVIPPATTIGTLPVAPEKDGYIFGGWFTEPDGKGTEFTASTPVTSSITVFAYWQTYEYTVTFDSQGADIAATPSSMAVVSPWTTVGDLPSAPEKAGYYFAGWYTEPDGEGIAFTAETEVTGNITVYACWSQNPTFIVTFDSQGADIAADPASIQVVSPETTVGTLPKAPEKTGYIFGGWFTERNGDGTEFTAETEVTGNITVYAYWQSYIYTVIFDSQGAGIVADPASIQVVSPETTVGTLPKAPEKVGYYFIGWYTEVDGHGTEFTADTKITGNITVYAYWWPKYEYTVTFDGQGADIAAVPSSMLVIAPETTVGTLPEAPEKEGYCFVGWYTEPDGKGTAFTAETEVTGNITVYAYFISDKEAICFSSDTSFTISSSKDWDGTLWYSNDNKSWTVWNGSSISSGSNNRINLIGKNIYIRSIFHISGNNVACTGNIETLLDYEKVAKGEHPVMESNCYKSMFEGCTSLTQAPALPATTLAEYCYKSMFEGCTSLTQTPALPATTLAMYCYERMFYNCTSLTQAPALLPATTLEDRCYMSMFYNCTSLTQAPALSATTLAQSCYSGMFSGCTSLTQAPALPATTLAWYCYEGMFYNCTSLTQAPALPATTLAWRCYKSMFEGCTSLTQIPALPATTLVTNCYESMFSGCTKIKLSVEKIGDYKNEYRIPVFKNIYSVPSDALSSMFEFTGGTFADTPWANTTYYTSNDVVY